MQLISIWESALGRSQKTRIIYIEIMVRQFSQTQRNKKRIRAWRNDGGDTSRCGWNLLHINNEDKSPDGTVPSQLTKPLWSPCKSNQTVLLDRLQTKSHQDPTEFERNHSMNWATFNSLPKPWYITKGSHQKALLIKNNLSYHAVSFNFCYILFVQHFSQWI